MAVRRRTLGGAALGLGISVLAGCGNNDRPASDPAARRVPYADGGHRFGDLYRPAGTPRGTVVAIHGGYWYSNYTLSLMAPIARALQRDGWAVWNLEYRSLGNGGGWPATFEDVAAGVDHVAELDDVPHDDVRLLGHSAGGQLAVWAASRTTSTPGGPARVRPSRVVSLAGVLDLALGFREGLGGDAVAQLMGGTPEDRADRYRTGDPTLLVPATAPVVCLRGREDTTVPKDQSTSYITAATLAGGTASLTEVAGDHFTIIDPTHTSWRTTSRLLTSR